MSFPSVSYFDPEGNLYLGDWNWSRVLVYRTPLAQFSPAQQVNAPPLCTITTPGQTTWVTPLVRARRINDRKYGNDELLITGRFTMATGSFSSIDPIANGAQVEVRSATGSPRVSVRLPGGAYLRPGPGWRSNEAGTKFTFKNYNPGGTNGIRSMVVRDKGAGAVRVTIGALGGAFPLLPSDGPLTVTVVLGDASAGALGACGQITLAHCRATSFQTGVTCK